MENKRGLSEIVTTIIFVLLGIIALAVAWIAISALLDEGTNKLSLSSLTLDLQIESAKVNYTSGIATVKIVRNSGAGELTALKFIIEDTRNAEVYEEEITDEFPELGKRTFYINLFPLTKDFGGTLELLNITRISIAPVYYIASSEKEVTGNLADSFIDLNKDVNVTTGESGETGAQFCETTEDCPVASWIEETQECNVLAVTQLRRTYECSVLGTCMASTTRETKELCDPGELCFDGACVNSAIPCSPATMDTDCGIDGPAGPLACTAYPIVAVVQDYTDYSCEDNGEGYFCSSDTTMQIIEECPQGFICSNAECFEPLECTKTSDCWANPRFGIGYVCDSGVCVPEEPLGTGTVNSAWPYGIGEYFDSYNLPINDEYNPTGKFIIFPNSAEINCLKVVAFYNLEGSIPYIRLNVTSSDVTASDSFQIWETYFGCSFL